MQPAKPALPAALYVVGTPIGNREDLSARALRVLQSVSLIVSETPIASNKLLQPLGIATRVVSYLQPGRRLNLKPVLEALRGGRAVALVSEAGTPGINDPGGSLVAAVRAAGNPVVAVPGPNAVITAASVSGFPMDQFVFMGFVPHKKGRETFFKTVAQEERAVIMYESVHRIDKTLQSLAAAIPERQICLARELTKAFEQVIAGPARELALLSVQQMPRKGEFVVVVAPHGYAPATPTD